MFIIDPEERREVLIGPVVVGTANAMRAFDAPVRNPMLISVLPEDFFWNPEQQNITNALKLSSFSSFVVTVEHIIGILIIVPFILLREAINFYRSGKIHIISVLKDFHKREWFSVAWISAGSGLGLYFFLISFALGNPTVAILLQKTQPLITLLVAMLILKERPTRFYYIAVVLSIVGIILITFQNITILFSEVINAAITPKTILEVLAAICSLIAAAIWGSNTVFGRILTNKADYWEITTFRYIGGAIVLIFFNFIVFAYTTDNFNALGETFSTFPTFFGSSLGIPMTGLMCIIYSAILTGGIIPLTLYYFGLRWSKASVGGLAELTFPLLAVFVNFIFLGFGLTVTQILGALILFGVVTTLSYINAKEYEQEEQEPVNGE